MTKKTETIDEEAADKAALAKIADPNRPTQLDQNKTVDLETISHNWQPGSPAIDLSYPGVSNAAVNTVEQANKVEEERKDPEVEEISKEEYEERTKLDVTDKRYINPSLDHYKKGK